MKTKELESRSLTGVTLEEIPSNYETHFDLFPVTQAILREPPHEINKEGKQIVFPKFFSISVNDPAVPNVNYLLFAFFCSEKALKKENEKFTKLAIDQFIEKIIKIKNKNWPVSAFITIDER